MLVITFFPYRQSPLVSLIDCRREKDEFVFANKNMKNHDGFTKSITHRFIDHSSIFQVLMSMLLVALGSNLDTESRDVTWKDMCTTWSV